MNNLNNIQKVCVTFGGLAELILFVDWFRQRSPSNNADSFVMWSVVITVATWGFVLLWKSKK